METNRTEQPGGSTPVADDDVEQMRQRILRAPTAAEKAKAAEDRRFFNSKANAPEIAAYRQRMATLRANNERLATAGLGVVNFPTPPDLRDLSYSELKAQLGLLGRLLVEQGQTLDRHQEEVEVARWQAALAAEPPMVRLLFKRLEAAEAEIAELKAQRSERNRQIGRAEPVRPKALMGGMSIATGNGLCAEVSIPPSAARPDPSAARRIVSR
jgi:hypothetical protein